MSIKIFKRYEYKYALNEKQYRAVLDGIMPYVNVDAYCLDGKSYSLYNIYYDTSDYSVIRHSVSKPFFKEKLRLRSYYPEPEPDDDVFIELKKKCNGCVNKRRAVMKYSDAVKFLETGKFCRKGEFIHDQVASEIECYIKKFPIENRVYLRYDRSAYFLKSDKNIRITFDKNIRAGKQGFDGPDSVDLLAPDMYIMEIKLSNYMPLWLAALLSENKIFRHGFSKYGTYFNNYILPERKKQNVCIY